MPNREFPFNQPIHPEDNQSINRVFDRNYGNKLKSGDTTTLKYTVKDGDGEPLDKDRLITMNTKVILKYDGVIAYETAFDAIVENETDNYAGDLIARFKVEEVLPPDEKPYVIEFHFEELDQSDEVIDRFIFPSGNTLELFITPSALNSDSEAIGRANDERLDNAVKRAIESDVVLLDIKDQEQQRIDNETARQSAENAREETFATNETDRQSTFETNEDGRQETFENNESERQTNYNELVDTGIMQENINQKLSESEQTYAPRLTNLEQNDADLTAQLAQTANELDIKKIDKNSGAVTSADLSQEVKEQMTGGAVAVVGVGAVGTVNLQDGSVDDSKIADDGLTPNSTNYIETSEGFFDIKKIRTGGHYSHGDGSWVNKPAFVSSLDMPVEKNKEYVLQNIANITYWDNDGNFVEGRYLGGALTNIAFTNVNIKTVRLAIQVSVNELKDVKFYQSDGSEKEYSLKEHVKVDAVNLTNFIKTSKDPLEDVTVKQGGNFGWNNGVWYSRADYYGLTDIETTDQSIYDLENVMNITVFDSNGNFLTGKYIGGSKASYKVDADGANKINLSILSDTDIKDVTFKLQHYELDAYTADNTLKVKTNNLKGSLESNKIDAFPQRNQIMIKPDMLNHDGYRHITDGSWTLVRGYSSTTKIPLVSGQVYRYENVENITFYDGNDNFVSGNYLGGAAGRIKISDKNIKFARLAIKNKLFLNSVFFGLDSKSDLGFESQRTHALSNEISISETNIENHEQIKDTAVSFYTGEGDYLKIKNYLGNYQNTHPSIQKFENEWNGYKYWMAYTPYPNSSAVDENPCVVASNDLIHWQKPNGAPDPLVKKPSGYSYNSDTEVFYNSNTHELEVWYREVISYNTDYFRNINRITTKNGYDWTPVETIFEIKDRALDMLSPVVIYDENKYKVFYVSGTYQIEYIESVDSTPTNWTSPIVIDTPNNLGNRQPWHLGVEKTDFGYEYFYSDMENSKNTGIYYFATDLNFQHITDLVEVLTPETESIYMLYRPSFFKEEGVYYLFYGYQLHKKAGEDKGEWRMTLVTGKNPRSLKSFVKKDALREVEDVEIKTLTDYPLYDSDVLIFKDGNNAIINSLETDRVGRIVTIVNSNDGETVELINSNRLKLNNNQNVTLNSQRRSIQLIASDDRYTLVEI